MDAILAGIGTAIIFAGFWLAVSLGVALIVLGVLVLGAGAPLFVLGRRGDLEPEPTEGGS